MTIKHVFAVLLAASAAPLLADSPPAISVQPQSADFAALDADFAKWMAEAHVPGLVWGVVKNGELVHVKAMGVQDLDSRTPATPDTAFRIASMT